MKEALDLSGKVAVVTGGGRGLGKVMTLSLLERGAAVATPMHIETDIPGLREAAKALGAEDRLHPIVADIREAEACRAIIAEATATFGAPGILVNNAGLGMLLVSERFTTESTKFWQVEPDVWHRIIDTNLNGAFQMARYAAPAMIEAGWGRVINVTTSISTMQRTGYTPYGTSKAGLEASTRAWADDLAGTGVTANVLIPGGAADTDMLPGKIGDAGRMGADGKLVDPQVMAAPVRWLASNFADGVTGQRFIANEWDDNLPPERGAENTTGPAGFDPRPKV